MRLLAGDQELEFVSVPLTFSQSGLTNLFALKNNKTVAETIASKRYAQLFAVVCQRYPDALNEQLGTFLYRLKTEGDEFYLRFLNGHGDRTYCDFSISHAVYSKLKGLYCYTSADEVVYLGRSHDPFEKRINHGYGHISPKNCYLDGQSTNCHLNSLIAENAASIAFYVCPLTDRENINNFEKQLIKRLQPRWNTALK